MLFNFKNPKKLKKKYLCVEDGNKLSKKSYPSKLRRSGCPGKHGNLSDGGRRPLGGAAEARQVLLLNKHNGQESCRLWHAGFFCWCGLCVRTLLADRFLVPKLSFTTRFLGPSRAICFGHCLNFGNCNATSCLGYFGYCE